MRKILWSALGLIAATGLVVWLVILPAFIGRTVRVPLNARPSDLGVAYEDVAFATKGGALTIRAWWMPAQNARGVLIFVHGANANRRDVYARGLEIAKFLTGQQISVLAPDLRNHGLSDGTKDGRLTLGVDEAKDVLGAVDFAAAMAPGLPIYLLGDSMGGAAPIYATAGDARIKRLVLSDPVLDPASTEPRFLHAALGAPDWAISPMLWSARTFYNRNLPRRDPLVVARTLRIPVLLIQDDHDPINSPAYAQRLAADNPHVTLWSSIDPGAENPVIAASGRWGAHVAAFRLHPQDFEQRLSSFLSPDQR
jgi:uncharacterized protein